MACSQGAMQDGDRDVGFDGSGYNQGRRRNVREYKRLAEARNASAQLNVGTGYMRGTGVAIDQREVIKWYTRAAESGYDIAQAHKLFCFSNGEGFAATSVKQSSGIRVRLRRDTWQRS